ncbi:iron-containing alcohol dehydrogenase [Desulfurivibrio sp. C05AmB]|uniref:iron-containing alcohol dehydrogenase n=1 Tax=Desulfurivibrio sp. C05AmB TaxID=3374371 RepID=UPI00376F42CE
MNGQAFTVTQPTRIRFGFNTVNDLAALVRELGGSRVFLVIDPGVVAAGLLEPVSASLAADKIPFTVYDRVDPEPGLKLADNGAKLARKGKCDCVVGVGGGSAMDIAKAVSILLTNGGKAEDYIGLGKIAKNGVPKIMIPTTAGTGAEVTFTAVFINEKTGSKAGMNGDPLYPDAAILDPALTLSIPPHVTATTGIDALTHALEAYVSTQAHTISDMYALEAIDLIASNLGKAYANGGNIEARSAMLLGSLLAGKALATAGVGLVHAMAYPLGGMHKIPHGLANAVLLPYVMAYNLIGAPERFSTLAEMFGVDVSGMTLREAAEAAVEAVWRLNDDVGIPKNLQELGIPREDIPEMAKIALTVARPVANNPRRPSREEVEAIYEEAMNGWE